MWAVDMQINGRWVRIADGFPTRDDAEWAIAQFKQQNLITNDGLFKYVETNESEPPCMSQHGNIFAYACPHCNKTIKAQA